MPRIISLKYAAKCRDCGADLEVGARARYYGRGRIYGVDCHHRNIQSNSPRGLTEDEHNYWSPGRVASHYDPHGAYSPDGTYLGSTGPRCEDAPCCGCCS